MEPPEFWQLSGKEQQLVMLSVSCSTCHALAGNGCKWSMGSPGQGGMHAGRHNGAAKAYKQDPGILEWAQEMKRREDQRQAENRARSEEAQTLMEVMRTCPWCGQLYDTVEQLTEHEVGCE